MIQTTKSRPKVLIVDDQASNIEVISEALDADHELFAATSAERALALARGVDLVLLDVLMPDVNGFDLCRALKRDERTRDIPVIFVTALGDVEDETRGFEAGGVDYITKPISPAIVRARVRTHLDLRAARKRLEREAETLTENLRLKEDVERMSRHDLKTPLTSIIAIPQAMLEEPGLTQDQQRLLRAIETSGYRILEMINRSLDLFRMESGAYEYQPASVDLSEMLDRLTVDLSSLARERGVAIDIPSLPPRVFAEELLTYSMLANLLKNAIEAAPPRTRVAIRVERVADSDRIAISISNRGAVPVAIRDTFFDKYASSGKKSGTGLGTYSARLMAETQGGQIEMATSEEHGTTVTVRLAAAPEASAPAGSAPSPAALPDARLRASRVLIVDDDEPTRVVLSRFLSDARSVAIAVNGEDALRQAKDGAPDIILLDSEMPGLDGPATARRLRSDEALPHAQRRLIIGLSSHDDDATRQVFLAAGCDLVLAKPVSRAAIVEAIEKGSCSGKPGAESDAARAPLVIVDAELVPLIPGFLESRRDQARLLEESLRASRIEESRALAHKLRGGLEMCGFMDAGAMSAAIETALTADPSPEPALMLSRAADLRAYLERVRYRAG